MIRLASLVNILREKKREYRQTRLTRELDTGFDKISFFLIWITKEKRKTS